MKGAKWLVLLGVLGWSRVVMAMPGMTGVGLLNDADIEQAAAMVAPDSSYRIIAVEATPGKLTSDIAAQLLKWAQRGGSVWLYDCREAEPFGMQAAPLTLAMLPSGRLRQGDYGGKRDYAGIAIPAKASGKNRILRDVDKVAVFVIQVGDDAFSAVKAGGDVEGLLAGSPVAPDRFVAAIRPVGQGSIIFKPLVYQKTQSSRWFQRNLRDFALGRLGP